MSTINQAILYSGTGTGVTAAMQPSDREGSTGRFQLTLTSTGSITWQHTVDGSTWVSILATNEATGGSATTATASGIYTINASASFQVRANITANGSGVLLTATMVRGGGGGGAGGSGGGAITVADGSDVALGTTTDAAVTNPASDATVIAALKGILTGVNAATPAGTNFIGTVGGTTAVLKPTATVSTSAYTSGDNAGGKITIANAVRVSAGTGVLQSLQLLFKSGTAPTGVLLLFDADPSAATITDNAAFAWSTDQAKCIGMIPVIAGDLITVGSQIVAKPTFTPIPIKAASGTSLYAAYVLTSTPTFTATSDMLVELGILQD